MVKHISLKTIVKISAACIVIVGIVVLLVLDNGISLPLKEYQRISASNDNLDWKITRVIDTQEDELAIEEEFDISIQDGTDFERYSLLLSESYEITRFTMFVFWHPNTCTRGDEKCAQIAICERELGKKHENTFIIYLIKQKNIISSEESEINYL